MKVHTASIINAVLLISLGCWAYFGSETPSKTAFIPVGFGVIIATLYPSVKQGHRITQSIAGVVTLLILAGLVKPLTAAIGRSDPLAIARVSVMILSTLIALFYFIKNLFARSRA